MFAFGKNKELMVKLEEYLKQVENTIDIFQEAMEHFIKNGLDEHFQTMAKKVHQCESNADDMRRGIELDMYKKSLLPETREDLLEIIEHIDRVPNRAETIVNIIITQKTALPEILNKELLELIAISKETFSYTLEATLDCFGKRQKIREFNRLVDNNESLGDGMERDMITKIFDSDEETGMKILQKELIIEVGAICDLCETVLDRIVICSIKRHI